ncbi:MULTISPECIES: calcium/proton exchanger [Stenotrophomonas]|uniref:calcium/proton exchanger n=1 Tax=Stenotrophomonas TaxID=40323 RepID=UPI000872A2F5|nr:MULTISPECIES: calcium/proton exchanger [Stenotrophomonas]OEZ02194.1 calcium/proton exchanger [Stenotrophomonas sp. BIIR7]
MYWMLLLVPLAIVLHYLMPDNALLVFGATAFAIVPLAALMSRATGALASRLGPSIGGLLNATFGNAAEFIIALAALREGLHGMVKASIAGTIIGNIVFVLGLSMVLGGLRNGEQRYDARSARMQATMLTLAVFTLILPASYKAVVPGAANTLQDISLVLSGVLLLVYLATVVFTLRASRRGGGEHVTHDVHGAPMSNGRAALLLGGTSLGIIWLSEILVGVVEPAGRQLGFSDAFTGVFVLAVIGGAAEQATALVAARKNLMTLSLSIALGSGVQLALLVAPLLVLLSYVVGPAPMSLEFGPGLLLSVLVAVIITGQVASDGRSDWLRGVQLLGLYVILATLFWFVPDMA